jgi:hypothetical protein
VATTKLHLVTGEQLEVDGSPDEVAKVLENARRSSPGSLAWLRETVGDERLGVNPAQVVTVRAGKA